MMIGQSIGPFTVDSELGSGAMGTVYKGRLTRADGRVTPIALKVVSFGLVGNDGAMARFDREAAILKQLKHPHIVRLLATGHYRKTPFIAMEYVDGESLDKTLARRSRLDWAEVIPYGQQLCDALQHAHDKGIVHRDLKPSNLMVTKSGVLKLTDFGIAKDTDVTALTGANSTIGTAAYMSPEQCRGDKTLGPKSDLYSLGICLYELLTGKKPFTAESTVDMFLKHVNETPVRPRRLVPDLPVWFDNLVMFLLEKNKDNRPLDAGTVGRMLGEIVDKVQSQQSVGAEVANARRADRPVGAAPVSAAERETARALRGNAPGKKKRKKKAQSGRPPVLLAALIGGPVLALFLGAGAYLLWPSSAAPETAESAFRAVQEAKEPADRRAAAEAFLNKFPTGPVADQARGVVRDAVAGQAEAGLLRRYGKGLKNLDEGFEPGAYKLAFAALDAEAAGRLADAAGLWRQCKAACPAGPADGSAPAEFDALSVGLGWAADRRVGVIEKDVRDLAKRLAAKLNQDRLLELDPPVDPGSPDSTAGRALRLEQFPDPAKARTAWDGVAALTKGDADRLAHHLLAVQHKAQLGDGKDADPAARLKAVRDRVTKLDAAAKAADAAPIPQAAKRDVRNGCRDVLALYADEPGDDYKPHLARARRLLDSLAIAPPAP